MSDEPDPTKLLEPVIETAKAVQEASKLGVEFTRTIAGGGQWLDGVLGDTIRDVVGLLIGDRVHYARLRAAIADEERLAEVIDLALERISAIAPDRRRALPPRVGLALLENASLEAEVTLQERWAALLARAIDEDEDPITKIHVSVLAELEIEDAVALEDYYHSWITLDEKPYMADGVTYGPGLDGDVYGSRVTANLFRLGLIEPSWIEIQNYEAEQSNRYGVFGDTTRSVRLPGDLVTFRFTGFGVDFCKAVGLKPGEPGKTYGVAASPYYRRTAQPE